ncbi:hypothetical protein RYX36_013741 [Vicia faba]
MLCHLVPLPRKEKPGSVLVYLNVYDLTPMNGYAYWFGLGVYHSGVQVHGVEYGFGAHERETTGIFEVQPGHCPGFTFSKAIYIGSTDLGPNEVRGFMEKLSQEYAGNNYHLIQKNCNHFCSDVCVKLTGKSIPRSKIKLWRMSQSLKHRVVRIMHCTKDEQESDFSSAPSISAQSPSLPPHLFLPSTTIRSASDFNKFRHRPPLLPRLISQLPQSDVCLASSG